MVANVGILYFESLLNSKLEESFTEDRSAKRYEATVENFDHLMAVNTRGTMLCYKHAGKQMISQGHGGRIIGAFLLSPPPFVPMSISRGLFSSRKTGSPLPLAWYCDEAHLI